jgi:hypothetical protein
VLKNELLALRRSTGDRPHRHEFFSRTPHAAPGGRTTETETEDTLTA